LAQGLTSTQIAPTALRGIVTAACALAFTIGPFILSFILNAYGALDNSWAYKGSFVAQYGITGIGMIFWPFMPESPTWLLLKGKNEKAARALRRLGNKKEEVEQRISLIRLTLAEAEKETAGVTYAEW
jgi:SP family general alpha glucoside:H+ symporter-like MFS transporter